MYMYEFILYVKTLYKQLATKKSIWNQGISFENVKLLFEIIIPIFF